MSFLITLRFSFRLPEIEIVIASRAKSTAWQSYRLNLSPKDQIYNKVNYFTFWLILS
ncbi:MAG: hypothetical protein IJV35_05680 [Neisseriaceae bacterium]|nr:hypothetical protein [Neisseriaceae bacterium]